MDNNQPLNEEQLRILNRCNIIYEEWLHKDFNAECVRIIQNYDVKEVHQNYRDAYPIVAAVILDVASQIFSGNSYERVKREQKRLAHKFMKYKLDV